MFRMSLGAVFLLSLLPAVTLAQSAEQSAQERGEARQKVRRSMRRRHPEVLCQHRAAKGAMRACLEQHQTNLSSECNAARAERAAARAKDKG